MNCNDLRFIKTEENLKKSLLYMLESNRLEDISIKAICQEAKCSRNAFYQHYQTKESLYNAILGDIIATIEEGTQPMDRNQSAMNDQKIKAYTYKFLRIIDEHRSEFKSLRNGNELFLTLLSNFLYHAYLKHYSYVTDGKQITDQGELITRYFCCGIAGFIEQWLRADNISLETAQHNLDLCSHDNFKKMRDLLS
ncbi:MAG: TetR/AcrR family transcriptional regulator [Synergistes jonesii]|uniref:TetR/AcrR family transcriptional regulator n=1 Tax=Synergistes jonesii TaxID=2754 RepID=UPI002A75AD27|nr:TetR/AcrR family transcriptional regulator [Synergistes jonesii]MDY2985621.1 TetR/AcrR family transcriptional regulator [Synergistes jonesii]